MNYRLWNGAKLVADNAYDETKFLNSKFKIRFSRVILNGTIEPVRPCSNLEVYLDPKYVNANNINNITFAIGYYGRNDYKPINNLDGIHKVLFRKLIINSYPTTIVDSYNYHYNSEDINEQKEQLCLSLRLNKPTIDDIGTWFTLCNTEDIKDAFFNYHRDNPPTSGKKKKLRCSGYLMTISKTMNGKTMTRKLKNSFALVPLIGKHDFKSKINTGLIGTPTNFDIAFYGIIGSNAEIDLKKLKTVIK